MPTATITTAIKMLDQNAASPHPTSRFASSIRLKKVYKWTKRVTNQKHGISCKVQILHFTNSGQPFLPVSGFWRCRVSRGQEGSGRGDAHSQISLEKDRRGW